MPPPAIVMNMFYTGLGIARSLGERGIPVIGLTAKPIYGNYTRYADVRRSPDSRKEPEQLLAFLSRLGKELPSRGVIFPTRDDDVIFADRHRNLLARYFELAIPRTEVVAACLDKWDTYLWATKAGVNTPRCWVIQAREDMARVARTITYPCVMKPLSSHLWRQRNNWEQVGARKAFRIDSADALFREYCQISQADPRVLIQELVPGGDDQLFVAACFLDRNSTLVAAFTARKLVQIPSGFGTGCIVETVDYPELIAPAAKLLQCMGFTGIAEVEFKWDAGAREYKLIEINPRPWDQHRLGPACGIDLIFQAYCDRAGIRAPAVRNARTQRKWVAEDVLLTTCLRSLWKRDGAARSLLRLARGRRIYAIWSWKDPLPFLVYLLQTFGWELPSALLRRARAGRSRRLVLQEKEGR